MAKRAKPTPERIAAQMALEAREGVPAAPSLEAPYVWTDERIDRVVTSIARAAADREPRPREWTEGMHDVIDAAVHRALLLVVQAFHVELLRDRPATPSYVDRSSRGQRETLEDGNA